MLDGFAVQNDGIPIYVQLREHILALIGRGMLKSGSQLPTMRQVAVALRIDLNTVQRAYAELEKEGILTMVRGRGSFVAQAPPPPRGRQAETRALAAQVAAQARAQGIAPDELAEALKKLAEGA
jgi:GntR family transcriptional regulator